MSTTSLPVSASSPDKSSVRPRFSIVAAVYNVADYIEAYLSSLDRQTYGIENLEVILVDDGSTDGAGRTAERWARATRATACYLRQENAGQGAARNAGIEYATGEWVTFADPDDVLADDYFERVAEFLDAQSIAPDLLATRQLIFSEDHTQAEDKHPLRRRFGKDEVVDLARFPNRIQLSGCSAFFPLDRLEDSGLRFDPRIRPTFEDGHLIGRHLLTSSAPRVGFIRSAEYYYRKRVDGTSSVQSAWTKDEKYTVVPRLGYLDLLQRAARRHGRAPLWTQNTVLYDLLWYFRADARLTSGTGSVDEAVLEEFHRLCTAIFELIDVETILGFRIVPTPHRLRQDLVAGYKDRETRPVSVQLDALDFRQRLVRARWTYSGARPREAFYWRGRLIRPLHEKVRSIEYFGRALLQERIVWLPADGTLRVELDGRLMPLATHPGQDLPYQITPARMTQDLLGRPELSVAAAGQDRASGWLARVCSAPARRLTELRDRSSDWFERERWMARTALRLAGTEWARNRYASAWVLMDRQEQAQDNAEHLYRYLKRKRQAVNSWFVLDRTSPDWPRLEREGFRLVAYGSLQWRVLLLNARHVVSSHANAFVAAPLPVSLYGRPGWQFTFLQHGVGKDDYSRWLNDKRIHVLVTTTEAEERSFSGDDTPYVFTSKEVKRTGLPRHDALLARARKLAPEEVDRILVMPTWRRSLSEGLPGTLTPEERLEVFRSSDYAQHWFALLRSPELREAAERNGLRVSFLPHPNMTPLLRPEDLPEHVQLLSWDDVDVQDVFARTKLLLTDYSSIAFEVAFLGRPTLYYHFDRAEFFSGAQPYRRGYFNYERDGFGPVVQSHEEAVAALALLAGDEFRPTPEVAERIESTFGQRTGDSCYRVYKAISQLDRSSRPVLVDVAPSETARDGDPLDAGHTEDGPAGAGTREVTGGGLLAGADELDALLDSTDEPLAGEEGVLVGADGVLATAEG